MKLTKGLKNSGRKKAGGELVSKPAEPVVSLQSGHQTSSGSQTVTIEAKIDVGFGNTLFLRGEGQGLNWEQGVPLECLDGSTWQWSGKTSDNLKFKLLLNDTVWAQGENLTAAPGQKVQISPAF